MTDLFSSLVNRAFDRTPVLQRRQPTVFEPLTDAPFSLQSKTEGPAALEENDVGVESRPSIDERNQFVTRLPQPSIPREETELHTEQTRRALRSPHHDNPPPPTGGDTGRVEPVGNASKNGLKKKPVTGTNPEQPHHAIHTSLAAKREENTVRPQRSIDTIVERRVEREIVKEHSVDQATIKEMHTALEPTAQPKPSREDDGAQPKHQPKGEVTRRTTPKEQATVKPLIQQKPAPRRDAAPMTRAVTRAESRHSRQQQTPPVIHVTIGRVEVRATPVTAGKARTASAQPAGPKMSLEDYLRSRSEGTK